MSASNCRTEATVAGALPSPGTTIAAASVAENEIEKAPMVIAAPAVLVSAMLGRLETTSIGPLRVQESPPSSQPMPVRSVLTDAVAWKLSPEAKALSIEAG